MNKAKVILFYILSFTWGIIMSLIGSIIALALIVTGHKPKLFHHHVYFVIGKGWGGVSFGPFFLISKGCGLHTKQHESGHGIQNIRYGPFMVVISIMSACRYWYRELKYHRKNATPPTAYDDAWYEGEATKLGEKYYPAEI